jgi:putative transcriptional regulator
MAAIDWEGINAMTNEDTTPQIAENPTAPPDLSDAPTSALRVIHPPGGVKVRGILAMLDLIQAEFTSPSGFAIATPCHWEQGRSNPDATTRTLLFVIEEVPEPVVRTVARAATYRLHGRQPNGARGCGTLILKLS